MRRLKYLSIILLFSAASPLDAAQIKIPLPPATSAPEQDQRLHIAERERDIALMNERIVQAEFKRIESQSDSFQSWLGIYGLLLVLLVGLFGFFTYRDAKRVAVEEARKAASEEAAQVARSAVQEKYEEIEAIKNKAAALLKQTEMHEEKARELSKGAEQQLNVRPASGQPAAALTAAEQNEIERNSENIRKDKSKNWSIKDIKILMLEDRSNKDWVQLLQDANALYLFHGDDENARSHALFWIAYALDEMKHHKDSADGWEKYLADCPNSPTGDKAAAYSNWGLAQARLATQKKGIEATELRRSACEKYARAVAIKPDRQGAWYNWTIALKRLAADTQGSERRALYSEALEKAERAQALPPHDAQKFIDEIKAALAKGDIPEE